MLLQSRDIVCGVGYCICCCHPHTRVWSLQMWLDCGWELLNEWN